MDPGLRSPLVDFFKRGEVARDVCLMAAAGTLAPRAHEQLALLVLLSDDADPEVAATANATLALLPPDPLRAFLARSDVPVPMRDFFAARGIAPGDQAAADADAPLLDSAAAEPAQAEESEESGDQVLASLPIIERMKLAMKGTKGQRAQLIRDSNKLVAAAVLSSPKLTESEVETFSKMANVSEDVLRTIAMNRSWVKNYGVISGPDEEPQNSTRNLDADAAAVE